MGSERGIWDWERHLEEAKLYELQYEIECRHYPTRPPIISPRVNIFGNQYHIIFTITYYIRSRKKEINTC